MSVIELISTITIMADDCTISRVIRTNVFVWTKSKEAGRLCPPAGGIRDVYNIIESISPIHFWHHYLCSRLTITCGSASVAPAPRAARQSRASSLTVWSRSVLRACSALPTSGVRGELAFGGFSHGRDASCIRNRNARVSQSGRIVVKSVDCLGLQCWIVGSDTVACFL